MLLVAGCQGNVAGGRDDDGEHSTDGGGGSDGEPGVNLSEELYAADRLPSFYL